MTWKPIETHPRHNSPFLAAWGAPYLGRISVVYFDGNEICPLDNMTRKWIEWAPIPGNMEDDAIKEERNKIDKLEQCILELEDQLSDYKNKYEFMVNRAAEKNLEGYRELGSRAASAENERDNIIFAHARLKNIASTIISSDALADWAREECDGSPSIRTQLKRELENLKETM